MSERRLLLLPRDEGDAVALEPALEYARRVGASVTLAGVAEPPSRDLRGVAELDARRLAELVAEERREVVEAIRRRVGEGLELTVRLLEGTPFLAVIREVLRERYELVALPGESGLADERPFLPSTAAHLVRKCPCPVWLLRGGRARPPRSVAAALDADPEGERRALDEAIVEAAFGMGAAFSTPVLLVHALALHPSENVLRGRAGLGGEQIAAFVERATGSAEARLRRLAAERGLPGAGATAHVLRGRPQSAIPRFVEEARIDLLVLGTVGRTGIAGLLIGNTAEEILARTRCSVLAVKPTAFVTPVQPA